MKYKATKQNLKKAFGWVLIWTGRLIGRGHLLKNQTIKTKQKKVSRHVTEVY